IAVAYYGDHLAPGETEERSVCSLLLGVKRLGEVHDLFAVYRAPRRSASIASDDLVHLRRMAEAFNHRFAPGTIGRRSEALEFLTNCLPPWEGRRAWAERFLDMCYQARVLERGVVVADDVSLGDQLRHLREIARPAPGQALFVSAPNLGRFSQFTASRSPAPIEHLTGKGRKPIWFFVRGQVHADHHFLRVCNGIRTGVIGLSDIFWGGIPLRPEASAWKSGKGTRHLGNIVALVGPPGSGKTTWCLTLLTEFAKLGGVCVMLSPERDATDILGMLSTFGLEDPLGFRTADAGSSPDITGVLPGKGETKGLLYISGAPRFDLDTLASAVNKASSMLRDARQSIAPRRLYL
ncbi:MAG: hypothetical protein FJY85_24760, partial [Deltaproteobacteria bacterium]|nr:hypothetical protein [Deltaproteobacteria bacterium]